MDLDSATAPISTSAYPKSARMDLDIDILAAHTNAGVTKEKRGKQPRGKGRRSQRLKQEKGIQRATLVSQRIEKKVEKSQRKGKKIRERGVSCNLFIKPTTAEALEGCL